MTRSPYYQIPIAISVMAVNFKYFRDLHCVDCGHPFVSISDRIVSITDATSAETALDVAVVGSIQTQCPRHTCKQRYRLEFAV